MYLESKSMTYIIKNMLKFLFNEETSKIFNQSKKDLKVPHSNMQIKIAKLRWQTGIKVKDTHRLKTTFHTIYYCE